MSCPDEQEIVDLLEGRLTPERSRAIERHVDNCSLCAELLAALARSSSAQLTVGTPAEGFLDDPPEPEWPASPEGDCDLPSGTKVDHFRVMRLLGRGGMGAVYLAHDTRLGRRVALKMMRRERFSSPTEVRRFLLEARATARLNHPHIVTVFHVGEHRGSPYLALEYLDGETLRQRLRRGRIGLTEGLELAVSLNEALGEAHRHGVLHRDLKPENIVLPRDGRVRVVDFGLARMIPGREPSLPEALAQPGSSEPGPLLTVAEGRIGTPAYMAPEQWSGLSSTEATDVWAFGVLLHEIFAGQRPVTAQSAEEIAAEVTAPTALPLADLSASPRELVDLIADCVRKDPSRRPTATQVADRLGRIQRELRRARYRRMIGVVVMVFAAVISAVFAYKERQARWHQARAEHQRAEAECEGARVALRSNELLEARAKLRASLETEDSPLARGCWWELQRSPIIWRGALGGLITALAVSPDGRVLALASTDHSVHVIDLQTYQQRARYRHGDQVYAVAFSPNGAHLATGTFSGELKLWSISDGSSTPLPRASGLVTAIDFSPEGTQLAVGDKEGNVELRTVAGTPNARRGGGTIRRSSGLGRVLRLRFSSDRRQLFGAGHRGAWSWPLGSPAPIRPLVQDGAASTLSDVAFSADGNVMATGAENGALQLWDLRRLSLQATQILSIKPSAMALGGDGRALAMAGADGSLWIGDPGARGTVLSRQGRPGGSAVNTIAFVPRRGLVAAGRARTIELRDLTLPDRPAPELTADASFGLALHGAAQLIASTWEDGAIRLQDLRSGADRGVLPENHGRHAIEFGPEGRSLAAAAEGGSVRLWDLTRRALALELRGHSADVWALSFSPDGRALASGSADRTVALWSLEAGARRALLTGHTANVSGVAYSPDATLLATASADQTVRLWEARTGRLLQTFAGHQGTVYGVAFGSDGKTIFSGGEDGTVRRWDLTGRSQVLARYPARVYWLALSPDGTKLGLPLSSGAAQLLDLRTGASITLKGHRSEVNFLRFTPDARRVATNSDDGSVRLWEVQSGRPVWHAPLLLSSPVRLSARSGWIELEPAGRPTTSRSGRHWERSVTDLARRASADESSALLCLGTFEDELELWDRAADRRIAAHRIPALEDVVAVPQGCVALAAGRVRLYRRSGEIRSLVEGRASVVQSDRAGILVATDQQILELSPAGEQRAAFRIRAGATALTRADSGFAVGYRDGSIDLVSLPSGEVRELSYEEHPLSAIERLLVGPERTLVVGYVAGFLGLWDLASGKRIHLEALRGPVRHLLLNGSKLYAASELASSTVWDLRAFTQSYCDLMREVWQQVPLTWEGGRAVLRPPPQDHPCR